MTCALTLALYLIGVIGHFTLIGGMADERKPLPFGKLFSFAALWPVTVPVLCVLTAWAMYREYEENAR